MADDQADRNISSMSTNQRSSHEIIYDLGEGTACGFGPKRARGVFTLLRQPRRSIRRYPFEAPMTVPDRITAISAAAILALAISLPLAMTSPAAAASRPGPSPFCLMPGSSNGRGGAPEICGYFDYR
jgi:hypothetical protein